MLLTKWVISHWSAIFVLTMLHGVQFTACMHCQGNSIIFDLFEDLPAALAGFHTTIQDKEIMI